MPKSRTNAPEYAAYPSSFSGCPLNLGNDRIYYTALEAKPAYRSAVHLLSFTGADVTPLAVRTLTLYHRVCSHRFPILPASAQLPVEETYDMSMDASHPMLFMTFLVHTPTVPVDVAHAIRSSAMRCHDL